MSKNRVTLDKVLMKQMLGLMILAYLFSFVVRMIWVWQVEGSASFWWNNQLMINTNDGYFFASGVQKTLEGLHASNPRVFGWLDYGVIFFTTLLVKFTPMSLETAILYMPAIISSLVVIPIILIARLYNQTFWGFFAALLGSIAWSYYNRTMTGYYDTDMFSAMAPMFILFFLMKSTIDFNLRTALYAAIAIAVYPFLYDAGLSIVYAMGIMYGIYMIIYHPKENTTYLSLILVFMALLPVPLASPLSYLVKVALVVVFYFALRQTTFEQKRLIFMAGVVFLLFLYFGNVFHLIFAKVSNYIATGTSSEGLRFYSVTQTVREAGDIPFSMFAHRTSGSQLGVIIALIGYLLLVVKHRAFILALPLIGIGIFSLFGGLRFTVYAVPIAAMSAMYAFYYFYHLFEGTKQRLAMLLVVSFLFFIEQLIELTGRYIVPNERSFVEALGVVFSTLGLLVKTFFAAFSDKTAHFFNASATPYYELFVLFFMFIGAVILYLILEGKAQVKKSIFIPFLAVLILIPNLSHVVAYKVPTVLKKAEVEDLAKLKKVSDSKDYTLAWWDYGYPIWYYSGTSTLIDGGKHNNDNFIISTIMQTNSAKLAARLARLSVETYVDSNYRVVADTLFKNGKKDQVDTNLFLMELESENYTLPPKTRDVFLYLPYRMLNIFPTVAVFGNIDLMTGEKKRKIEFYVSNLANRQGDMLIFQNGIVFDERNGVLHFGRDARSVKYKVTTQEYRSKPTQVKSKMYQMGARLVVLELRSYNQFIIMDEDTFNSMYVQMLLLGRYNKELFELSVSSPYGKIYKLKI